MMPESRQPGPSIAVFEKTRLKASTDVADPFIVDLGDAADDEAHA
jgi:hypothetical protein